MDNVSNQKVVAARGATTVQVNEENQILESTKELLQTTMTKNNISEQDIISILFTTTSDLNATFPAKAARLLGLTNTPLMCASEIDVPDSLPKCIRILIHFYTSKSSDDIASIYLKDAEKLRPDLNHNN